MAGPPMGQYHPNKAEFWTPTGMANWAGEHDEDSSYELAFKRQIRFPKPAQLGMEMEEGGDLVGKVLTPIRIRDESRVREKMNSDMAVRHNGRYYQVHSWHELPHSWEEIEVMLEAVDNIEAIEQILLAGE